MNNGAVNQTTVSESIEINAPLATVWALVSDPGNYSRWSPEATGIKRRSAGQAWAAGDVFTGNNKALLPWSTTCTVTTFRPDEAFAFVVDFGPMPVAEWSYELSKSRDGRTLVTERWVDRRHGVLGAIVKPAGLLVGRGRDAAARNRSTMRLTLSQLKAEVESKSTN